jgi:hypothetical protein
MNKKFTFFAILFLIIGVIDQIMNVLGHYFSPDSFSLHYHFFIISIILFILADKYRTPEPTLWVCENCDIELRRPQIKFGLCPKCGKKIKNFQGMTARIDFDASF